MTYLLFGIFLCLPPLLLALKFIRQKPSWWVIIIAIAVGGWLAWFLSVVSHFEELQSAVSSMENPDPNLLDQAYSDGGPLVLAAFFGWLVALLYAFPWWVIYTRMKAITTRWPSGIRTTPEFAMPTLS